MTYTVVSWKEEKLWSTMCPAIPGVFGVGKTRAASEKDFRDALNTLLEYLDDLGEDLPSPQPVHTASVRVA